VPALQSQTEVILEQQLGVPDSSLALTLTPGETLTPALQNKKRPKSAGGSGSPDNIVDQVPRPLIQKITWPPLPSRSPIGAQFSKTLRIENTGPVDVKLVWRAYDQAKVDLSTRVVVSLFVHPDGNVQTVIDPYMLPAPALSATPVDEEEEMQSISTSALSLQREESSRLSRASQSSGNFGVGGVTGAGRPKGSIEAE